MRSGKRVNERHFFNPVPVFVPVMQIASKGGWVTSHVHDRLGCSGRHGTNHVFACAGAWGIEDYSGSVLRSD